MSGKYENAMLLQVLSVPELLEQVYPDVEPQVRYVLTTPPDFLRKKGGAHQLRRRIRRLSGCQAGL